jgi:hypothetical protein
MGAVEAIGAIALDHANGLSEIIRAAARLLQLLIAFQ